MSLAGYRIAAQQANNHKFPCGGMTT